MTLDEFRATGRDVQDVTKVHGWESFDAAAGRVYHGDLVIEGTEAEGWCLTVGGDTKTGKLPALESELYDYGVLEGIVTAEAPPGTLVAPPPRWCCPSCKSLRVQISLPTWYRESSDFSLTFVQTDSDADPLYWYCESCEETGTGAPDEPESPT